MIKAPLSSRIWKITKNLFFSPLITFAMNFNKIHSEFFEVFLLTNKRALSYNLLGRGNDNLEKGGEVTASQNHI